MDQVRALHFMAAIPEFLDFQVGFEEKTVTGVYLRVVSETLIGLYHAGKIAGETLSEGRVLPLEKGSAGR